MHCLLPNRSVSLDNIEDKWLDEVCVTYKTARIAELMYLLPGKRNVLA